MTLLALSLAVGLLIDDAIVVRENIFRHMELGEAPAVAASVGTKEVIVAVIATTLCIMAVFAPIGFTSGIIGQFLKEFGLTVCFALIISSVDAITMGPMLSAYYGGLHSAKSGGNIFYKYTIGPLLLSFDKFQDWLAAKYEKMARVFVRWPKTVILVNILIFASSLFLASKMPMNFMKSSGSDDFTVSFDVQAGITLDNMEKQVRTFEKQMKEQYSDEIASIVTAVGNANGESNVGSVYMKLVPAKDRKVTVTEFKEKIRADMTAYKHMNPQLTDGPKMGGGMGSPFSVNIVGNNMPDIIKVSEDLMAKMKEDHDFVDINTNYKPGKPEYNVEFDQEKGQNYGVSSTIFGAELRILVEGSTPAVYREKGKEYDIVLRLQEDQRDIKTHYPNIFIPNINNSLVKLSNVSNASEGTGPSTITREQRGRYIRVTAGLTENSAGLGSAKTRVEKILTDGTVQMPEGVYYKFTGQSEELGKTFAAMLMAALFAAAFIYLVLASLYESFVTPFTIMLVFPLAMSGAFFALYPSGLGIDMMSMIGCLLLMGLATKNSILLVDYAKQQIDEKGLSLNEAIILAGKVRLRPILMTSLAMIAGMAPLAIGLSEISGQRAGMGIAVIGGVVSSTLLTLILVPAVFGYMERFRMWSLKWVKRIFAAHE
jgi:HAE1 family hydrophobic/amphiphilic exporter-1